MNFIAIDWGSTNFRAYRVESDTLTDTLSLPLGLTQLPAQADFQHILFNALAPWQTWQQQGNIPILMAGMIGSNRGWQDCGYQMLPLSEQQIAQGARKVVDSVYIHAGLAQQKPANVMRGEEIQLLGALQSSPAEAYVFPGTHSKWIWVDHAGNQPHIQTFNTFITGELYQLLLTHSLIGEGLSGAFDNHAFQEGLHESRQAASVIEQLFTLRARRMLHQRDQDYGRAWLSGLLIGHEVHSQLSTIPTLPRTLAIVGHPNLARLYHLALADYALTSMDLDVTQTTLNGFRRMYAELCR